jgi:hypothetical protein
MLANDCLHIILSDNADNKLIMGQLNRYWYNVSKTFVNPDLLDSIRKLDHFSIIRHQNPQWYSDSAVFYVVMSNNMVLQNWLHKFGSDRQVMIGLAYTGNLTQLLQRFDSVKLGSYLHVIMEFACYGQQAHICEYMMEHYTIPDNHYGDMNLMNAAALTGRIEVVKFLAGKSYLRDVEHFICLASYSGHFDVVKKLTQFEMYGESMFYCAAYYGYMNVVKCLMSLQVITPYEELYACWLGAYMGGRVDIFNYITNRADWGFEQDVFFELHDSYIDRITPQLKSLDPIMSSNLRPIPISVEGKAEILGIINSM